MVSFCIVTGYLIERGVHFILHLKPWCVKCTFFFFFFLDDDLKSFHFEICADLPPGRHTMILYCDFIPNRPECRVSEKYFGHVFREAEETNMWPQYYWSQIALSNRLFTHEGEVSAFCRTHTTWLSGLCLFLILCGFCATYSEKVLSLFLNKPKLKLTQIESHL